MLYSISKDDKSIKGSIQLPASKSISNRVLIIQALCKKKFKINNLSKAQDTQILQNILANHRLQIPVIDAGAAGTAFRFLTAFLATQKGEWILTGSERMLQRPIKILVDTLQQLGANIQYLNKKGFPPLKIKGTKLKSKEIFIDGSVSSQYITALLLIAPCLPNGLKIHLTGNISSQPYIDMTLNIMKYFGVKSKQSNKVITIAKQDYVAKDYFVEPDWSAASYWYEIATLADSVDLQLVGLKKNSLQGDVVIAKIMENLGIKTIFTKQGVKLIRNINIKSQNFEFDFTDCPDLAQTVIVACAMLKINGKFYGLESLKIKETDRIKALQTELIKFGVVFRKRSETSKSKNGKWNFEPKKLKVETYDDHRMAMAFAPLALKYGTMKIKNPEVVVKSYPHFWDDLKKVGFEIKEKNKS